MAIFPLRCGEECIGLLQLNDRRPGRFTEETIALWERLAGSLAVALSKLRAEEQLELQKRAIDAHFDGAYWLDTSDRFIYVNDAGCKAIGYSREELIGKSVKVISVTATDDALKHVWERLRKDGHYHSDTKHRRKDVLPLHAELVSLLREWLKGLKATE